MELGDPLTYEAMDDHQDAIHQCSSAIVNWTVKWSNEPGMTEKLKKWVIPSNDTSFGNNYMNFKAHKPEKNYPGRLISTGMNTPTKSLAVLTAFELKKVDLKYNIKDTDHFLQKLDELNNSGKISNKKLLLCSFDIVSMFPSISKDLGLPSCNEHLEKRECKIFSNDCILEAIEITLDHNLTMFNEKVYRQKCGAAMGGSNSCDYADIALARLDEMIHEHDLVNDHGVIPPIMYARFRDDIFLVYDGELESSELTNFFNFCNNYHSNIKFTMTEPNNVGIEFLNTFVYIKDDKLYSKPYSKPCDSHNYLVPSSCHPLHTIKNIPYGTAHNVFKLSSETESYELAKAEFSDYLMNRGYSKDVVSESFVKVEQLNRHDLIYKSNKGEVNNSTRNFPLVCDFNPSLPPVASYIHKYKYLLELDDNLKKVINPRKIFVSYRGNKTIKDILVPSKLRSCVIDHDIIDDTTEKGCFKCEANCKLCRDFIDCPDKIKSFHTNQEFSFKYNLNCKSKNIIYKLDDLICKKTSVGSSITGMSTRWTNHKSHIRKSVKSCEIANHFSSTINHVLDKKSKISIFDDQLKTQIRVTIIDQIYFKDSDNDDFKLRKLKEKEAFWQNQLKTLSCYGGFNKRDARKETSSRSYLTDKN